MVWAGVYFEEPAALSTGWDGLPSTPGMSRISGQVWKRTHMNLLKAVLALVSLLFIVGCEGLPKPKDVDRGKVDRIMDQVENGKE